MMNNTENLLVIAMEEAAEVQQAIAKSLRFGMSNYYAEQPTNSMCILTEYYQLQAVIEELQKSEVLPSLSHDVVDSIKKAKISKVNYYNEESRRCERLND